MMRAPESAAAGIRALRAARGDTTKLFRRATPNECQGHTDASRRYFKPLPAPQWATGTMPVLHLTTPFSMMPRQHSHTDIR